MDLKSMWLAMGRRARWGLAVGAVVIMGATAALGWWAWHPDYEVLFAKLSSQDAAAMTRELEQMKVPYKLGEDGTTILVERAGVHQTRLKLMGKDLPLHGAVGFELFNNSDFGMTEFAQKVNYQRALQGELTRTILSLAEVESARVHIAFPDEGLFKREQSHAKASVTLTLRDGHALRREQVRGIQRLVAAAVTGIEVQDVTIVNDQGVALTQEGEQQADITPGSMGVELKRDIEQYLSRKANALLDKAFGPGQALASVDVTLDMRQVRVTTEDVVTPPAASGEGPVGVVLREKEATHDSGGRGGSNGAPDAATPTAVTREVDYQLGRRVEQVITSPGAVTQLQAVAVLRAPLSAAQAEQVRQLLGSAVGAVRERGDVVVVQPLEGLAATVTSPHAGALPPATDASAVASLPRSAPVSNESISTLLPDRRPWAVVVALSALFVAACWLVATSINRLRRTEGEAPELSPEQREARLAQLQAWLTQPEGSDKADGSTT